jgi:hypothetical protein
VAVRQGDRDAQSGHVSRDSRSDLAGDVVLDGEDVIELTVVARRPHVLFRAGVDELGGDANPGARLPHAALQCHASPEGAADLEGCLVAVLVVHRGGAGDDPQIPDVGEPLDQLFGHAVREIAIIRVGTDVGERENDNAQAVL